MKLAGEGWILCAEEKSWILQAHHPLKHRSDKPDLNVIFLCIAFLQSLGLIGNIGEDIMVLHYPVHTNGFTMPGIQFLQIKTAYHGLRKMEFYSLSSPPEVLIKADRPHLRD